MQIKQTCTAPNCERKSKWRTWHESFVARGAYLCGRCFSERKGRGSILTFPLFRSKHVRVDTVVIGKETGPKTLDVQIVNTTPVPITFVSGEKTLVLSPSEIQVKTVEEKQTVCQTNIDSVNIPFHNSTYRVLGLPQPVPGVFFIVDETVARAIGRSDLLSVGEPVLNESGKVVGYAGLKLAPSENEDVRELVLAKNKLQSELKKTEQRAEDNQNIMSDCLTTLGTYDLNLEKCRDAIRPVVEQGGLRQCPMHSRRACPECSEIVTLTYAELYALRKAIEDENKIKIVSNEIVQIEDLPLPTEEVA